MNYTDALPGSVYSIHRFYRDEALRVLRELKFPRPCAMVLKTDAFNEAMGIPEPGGVVLPLLEAGACAFVLEYDEKVCCKAQGNLPASRRVTVQTGDIRDLRFMLDQSVDLVLDCSTIDHIPPADVPAVIASYARVLQDITGQLLLWAWCSTSNVDQGLHSTGPWAPTDQYFFDAEMLETELHQFFDVEIVDALQLDPGQRQRALKYYRCTKRPWAYLQDPELDERFKVAAEWLHDQMGEKAGTAVVWDLNCGTARMYQHFAAKEYYANDNYGNYANVVNGEVDFYKMNDGEVAAAFEREGGMLPFNHQLDALFCFGVGAGHIVKNGWESETVVDSIKRIVIAARPQFVVLENPASYHGVLSDLSTFLTERGYTQGLAWVGEGADVRKREVLGYRR